MKENKNTKKLLIALFIDCSNLFGDFYFYYLDYYY